MFVSPWIGFALLLSQTEPGSPIIPTDPIIIPTDPIIIEEPGVPSFLLGQIPTSTIATSSIANQASIESTEPGAARNSVKTTENETKLDADLLLFLSAKSTNSRLNIAVKLAASRDERVLPLLSYISIHDNRKTNRKRASSIVGQFDSEAGHTTLARIAIFAPKTTREAALKTLGGKKGLSVENALRLILENKATRPDIIDETKKILVAMTGTQDKKIKSRTHIRNYFYPAAAGALLGATALQRIGSLGKTDAGPGLGFLGGGLIGIGTGILLHEDFSMDESIYYMSSTLWGLSMGNLLERAIFEEAPDSNDVANDPSSINDNDVRRRSFELLGELALVGGAYLMSDTLKPTWEDTMTMNAAGLTSIILTLGTLGYFDAQDDARPVYASLFAAEAIGLGVGAYLAKDLQFSSGDLTLIPYGLLEGAWYGGFLTQTLLNEDRGQAGVLLGAGLGIVGATILSQYTELEPTDVLFVGTSALYGKLLGTGIGLLINSASDLTTQTMLAGGALGIASAFAAREELTFKTPQLILTPAVTLAGFAHAGAIAALLSSELSGDQAAGLVLTTGTALGIGASLLSQKYELKTWDVTMSGLGWLWGVWFSGWTMALSEFDNPLAPLLTVVSGDAALALTSYLISPQGGKLDSRVIGWASLGGVGASAIAVLFTALITSEWQTLVASNLIGTAVGLGLGGYYSHRYFYKDTPQTPASNVDSTMVELSMPFQLLGVSAAPNLNDDGQIDGMLLHASFGL